MKVRIYYHHTDCGGVVYYANYLNFLEEARTEFLEQRGISIKEMIQKGGFFVVAHQDIDYRAPAFYGDILDIDTWISDLAGVRVEFKYTIKKGAGVLVAEARTIMVYVNGDLKPKPIPEEVVKKIGDFKSARNNDAA